MSEIIPLNFSTDNKKLLVGLSWDPNEKSEGVLGDVKVHNLDLSCAVFNADYEVCDIITPIDTKRDTYKGQIFHRGDNKSGGADFEDEDITVHLDKLDQTTGDLELECTVRALAFVVSTNDRVKFEDVSNGDCHFMDGLTLEPFKKIDLQGEAKKMSGPNASSQQHLVLGYVSEDENGAWTLKSMSHEINALEKSAIEDAVKSA